LYLPGKEYRRATEAFDGHDEMSTNAVMQQMRASGKVGDNVTFTISMSVTMKNDTF